MHSSLYLTTHAVSAPLHPLIIFYFKATMCVKHSTGSFVERSYLSNNIQVVYRAEQLYTLVYNNLITS